tara:strand:+ start:21 stop:620 length:600 start_codon:yes stop_codon:yes gene_type:complete
MIILLSNFRVGSSVFQREYSKKTGATYWIYDKNGKGGYLPYTAEYLHPFDGGYKPPHPKINLYKVMPDQFKNNFKDFKKNFLDESSEIIYLVRKNLTEQILSYAICHETKNWHPWQENWNQRFEENYQYSFKLDKQLYKHYETMILTNLHYQSIIYKDYPGKVSFLEDRFSEQIKYPDKVKIENEKEFHTDVDVEKYFK